MKKIFLLDAQTGDAIHILDGHPISPLNGVPLGRIFGISGYAFSPDGLRFATSHTYDEAAIIWSLETGEIDHILDRHEGGVQDVQFAPDSEYLIAVTRFAKTIKVWRSATGELAYEFPSGVRGVVAVSPDSRLLAIGYTGEKRESFIDVWDLQTGDRLHRFNVPLDVDTRLTFTADSHSLFATFSYITWGMGDFQPIPTTIRGWDIDIGQQIFVTQFNDGLPHSFLLNQDSSLIFIEQYNFEQLNGEVVIWDVANNCAVLTLVIYFDTETPIALRWLTEQYFLTSSGARDARETIIWRIN